MLLDRRHFLGGLPALMPAALAASAEAAPRTRFYVFEQYFLEQGTQPARNSKSDSPPEAPPETRCNGSHARSASAPFAARRPARSPLRWPRKFCNAGSAQRPAIAA